MKRGRDRWKDEEQSELPLDDTEVDAEPDDVHSEETGPKEGGTSDSTSTEPGPGDAEVGAGGDEQIPSKGHQFAEVGADGLSDGGPTPDPPSEPERILAEAQVAAREGRLEASARLHREVVARAPQFVEARVAFARLLVSRGSHDLALEQLHTALGIEPENLEALTGVGRVLTALSRFEESEVCLRRVLRIDPARTDARAEMGILYFRRGLYSQADAEFLRVLATEPDHPDALFYRGEVLNRLGRVDEALDTLERAVRFFPDNPRIYYLMGILFDRKDLPQEAGVMYRKAKELTVR